MPQSTLFMSSCSRRQLARRRLGRTAIWVQLGLVLILIAAGVTAFLVGQGTL